MLGSGYLAQRLNPVFDIEDLPGLWWGGEDHAFEESEVIDKILTHLDSKGACGVARRLPPCRAPPQASLFG